jgi:hypothetical protein
MILGMSLETFTAIHVLISLVGILTGVYAIGAMIGWPGVPGVTATFLATTVLTSATGYLFPAKALLPSHIVGAITLVCLLVAIVALYARQLKGPWRPAYVVSASLALYFNVVVLVIQGFLKVDLLRVLAPTQTETPFLVVQGTVLLLFVAITILALRRFIPV